MIINAVKTGVFKEGEDLVSFITKNVPKLKNGSIIVVTSKIVALSEGRTADRRDKDRIIREESDWVKKTKDGKLTIKDGILLWNAGIDESNADGRLILLPFNSFRSADVLRKKLQQQYKVKKLGVLITDSRVMPLRAGSVAIALGYAGFKGLRDYRGTKDMFGRKLKFTQTNIGDSLATVAALLMGEGKECQPLAVIEGASVVFTSHVSKSELIFPPEKDMYRPLFGRLRKKR